MKYNSIGLVTGDRNSIQLVKILRRRKFREDIRFSGNLRKMYRVSKFHWNTVNREEDRRNDLRHGSNDRELSRPDDVELPRLAKSRPPFFPSRRSSRLSSVLEKIGCSFVNVQALKLYH